MVTDGLHVSSSGRKWYKDGHFHREDGPAVIWWNGDEEWYRNGNRHRIGGPAVVKKSAEANTFNEVWYVDDLLHREDGPAMMFSHSGYSRSEWYIKGERVNSYKEYQDLTKHSDQFIMYLKLKYGKM